MTNQSATTRTLEAVIRLKTIKKEKEGKLRKSVKRKAISSSVIDEADNVGRNNYIAEVKKLSENTKHWENFYSEEALNYRKNEWDELDKKIESLCHKYAWAIPDDRALKILGAFSPLIEIGAGKGYWAKMLRIQGVDIAAYDKFIFSGSATKCFSKVMEGGPEKLLLPIHKNRNLFLCYPDESESMAVVALENFSGQYVIHVGEMIHSGTMSGAPVAPFGRTSSAEFQVCLTESFHCLLVCKLQMTYPNSKDCISVWKRTVFVPGYSS